MGSRPSKTKKQPIVTPVKKSKWMMTAIEKFLDQADGTLNLAKILDKKLSNELVEADITSIKILLITHKEQVQLFERMNTQSIEELYIKKIKLQVIPMNRDMFFLQRLSLNENIITSLEPLTKAQFPNLYYLSASVNHIESIEPLSRADLSNLQELFLRCNRISCVEPLKKMGCTKLHTLAVQNNHINSLEPLQFVMTTSLKRLGASNNLIDRSHCFAKFAFKLTDTQLDNNKLVKKYFNLINQYY